MDSAIQGELLHARESLQAATADIGTMPQA